MFPQCKRWECELTESNGRTSRVEPSEWELMRTIFGTCEGSGPWGQSLCRLTGWLADRVRGIKLIGSVEQDQAGSSRIERRALA